MYAAMVQSRLDAKPIDLEKALRRTVAIIIGRLRAYGKRWKRWVHTGRFRRNEKGAVEPRVIPQKHRDKKVIRQRADGEYEISGALWQLATDLGLQRN